MSDPFFKNAADEADYLANEELLHKSSTKQQHSTSSQTYNNREIVGIVPIKFSTLPEPRPRVDVIEGLIPKDLITILYGDGANAKSYLAMILAFHAVLGLPLVGIPTTQISVLYVDWELDENEQGRRAYKVARGMGLERPPENFFYYRAEQPLHALAPQLKAYIVEKSIGLVIIDSFGAACGGDSEQSSFVIPVMNQLRSLGTTCLVLDHQSKTQEKQNYKHKTVFGSVYKFNLARSVIQIQKIASQEGQLSLLLRPTKFNLGYLKEEYPLIIKFGENIVHIETTDLQSNPDYWDQMPVKEKILESLRNEGPGTAKEIANRIGCRDTTVSNELGRMKKAGQVIQQGKTDRAPIYRLPSSTTTQPIYGCEDVENTQTDANSAVMEILPGSKVVQNDH